MKYQQMNRLITMLLAAGVAMLISAGVVEAGAVDNSGPGPALVSSGFRVKTATTRAQREQVRTMTEDGFTIVKQGGQTYYLYVDRQTGQLYAGDQYAYQKYCRYAEMQRNRKAGAFVIDVKPRGTPVITDWHGWQSFREW